MAHQSKRSKANGALSVQGPQSPEDAIRTLKSFPDVKFDQSVEICVHLGIDPRRADQQLRGSIAMPHGIGRSARVACFCASDEVDEALAAGATAAGGEDLVERIEGGWMDFDVAVSTPGQMRLVSRLGRTLGPKGLMPSPKAGTVAPDIVTAVKEFAAGKSEYRNDDGGNIHCVIGRMSFTDEALTENACHFLSLIESVRPPGVKGIYVKKCVVSGTMTPSVQVAV